MLPGELLSLLFGERARLVDVRETALPSSGATNHDVHRLSLTVEGDGRHDVTLIRKRFRRIESGPHIAANSDPTHWAYWRREPYAYESGLLPDATPELRAPEYIGTIGDDLYLGDVSGGPVSGAAAARALGRWQSSLRLPSRRWLAGHQLAQRLAVTRLEPAELADESWRAVWAVRWRLLDALGTRCSYVISHGDCDLRHFMAADDGVVLLDWGRVGASPAGADAAQVALSANADVLDDYMEEMRKAISTAGIALAYYATLALTGLTRAHRRAARGEAFPAADLVTFASRRALELLSD